AATHARTCGVSPIGDPSGAVWSVLWAIISNTATATVGTSAVDRCRPALVGSGIHLRHDQRRNPAQNPRQSGPSGHGEGIAAGAQGSARAARRVQTGAEAAGGDRRTD